MGETIEFNDENYLKMTPYILEPELYVKIYDGDLEVLLEIICIMIGRERTWSN